MGDFCSKTAQNPYRWIHWILHCKVVFNNSAFCNQNLLFPSHYYVHSGDCADRFYRSAGQGEVVRRLKLKPMCPDCKGGMDLSDPRYPGELERLVKGEKEREAKKNINRVNTLQQLDFRDYVIPSEELEDRGTLIREGL